MTPLDRQSDIDLDASIDELDDLAQQPPAPPPSSNAPTTEVDDDATEDADAETANPDDGADEGTAEKPTFTAEDLSILEQTEDLQNEAGADAESEEQADTSAEPGDDEVETEADAEAEAVDPALLTDEVPDDAAGYLLPSHDALPADSLLLEGFKQVAHAHDLPQKTVTEILGLITAQHEALAANDEQEATRSKAIVAKAWGDGVDADIAVIKKMLGDSSAIPAGLAELIRIGRTADGRRLSNDVGVLNWLRDSAKARYGDAKQQRRERIAEIEAVRDRSTDEYFANGLSDELLALTQAEAANAPAQLLSSDQKRLREIEKVMNEDINNYYRQGLDKEYVALLGKQKRSARR